MMADRQASRGQCTPILIQRKAPLPIAGYAADMTQTVQKQLWSALRGVEPFSTIPETALGRVIERCIWHDCPANQLLIDGDREEPHSVFLITEGMVELSRRNAEGEAVPIGLFGSPSCFGEFAAVMNSPGGMTVRTVTGCRVAEIPEEAFRTLLDEIPSISLSLLKKAISIVRSLDEDIVRHHTASGILETAHQRAILRSS